MKKFYTVIFSLLFALNTLYAVEEENITDTMEVNIQKALDVLKDKEAPTSVKAEKIYGFFDPIFDYNVMARLSLGNQWKLLSKEQKKEFVDSFIKKLKSSYMNKLDQYTDEKIVIKDTKKVKKSRIYLVTNIIAKTETYEITYKFYKSKRNGWLIYDLDILGVSIIQTYRNQFAGLLKTKSFNTLLEKLKEHSI